MRIFDSFRTTSIGQVLRNEVGGAFSELKAGARSFQRTMGSGTPSKKSSGGSGDNSAPASAAAAAAGPAPQQSQTLLDVTVSRDVNVGKILDLHAQLVEKYDRRFKILTTDASTRKIVFGPAPNGERGADYWSVANAVVAAHGAAVPGLLI